MRCCVGVREMKEETKMVLWAFFEKSTVLGLLIVDLDVLRAD